MKSIIAIVVAVAFAGLSGQASALPFALTPGDQIADIDFSGGTATMSGGGTSLSITAVADRLELLNAGGGTTVYERIADNLNIAISTTLVLDPSTLTAADTISFHSTEWLSSGAPVDLTLIDLDFGTELLEAVLDGNALFTGASFNSSMTVPFLTDVTGGDLDFNLAFGPSGSVGFQLTGFSPGLCTGPFLCGSYADFNANAGGNVNPLPGWLPGDGGFTVPEPAALLLALFGFAAVARRQF